ETSVLAVRGPAIGHAFLYHQLLDFIGRRREGYIAALVRAINSVALVPSSGNVTTLQEIRGSGDKMVPNPTIRGIIDPTSLPAYRTEVGSFRAGICAADRL